MYEEGKEECTMRKKFLALLCAATMVMGMSLTVCAAGSQNASGAAQEAKSSTPAVTANLAEEVAPENVNHQVLDSNAINEFAQTTTVTGPAGASVTAVSMETAKGMISVANQVIGRGAFIASVVDLHGGPGTYTLGCPNVWAGQRVTVLHQKADGTYEAVAPSAVANNSVTFTLTSTSPVALVIDTVASPKTGDAVAAAAAIAMAGMGGAVVFGRKARD